LKNNFERLKMNTQHSQGPWRYDYQDGYCGEIVAKNGKVVATFTDEPSAPDARLIAAAPDLLEALKDIVEFWDSIVPTDAVNQMHINARAAIVKVTTN
jgi:hypothetical protein